MPELATRVCRPHEADVLHKPVAPVRAPLMLRYLEKDDEAECAERQRDRPAPPIGEFSAHNRPHGAPFPAKETGCGSHRTLLRKHLCDLFPSAHVTRTGGALWRARLRSLIHAHRGLSHAAADEDRVQTGQHGPPLSHPSATSRSLITGAASHHSTG